MSMTRWPLRADALRPRWAVLLLAVALLMSGCASVAPPPSRGVNLRYTPRATARSRLAKQPSDAGGRSSRSAEEPERQSAIQTRQAVLAAVAEVSGSLRGISGSLPKLASYRPGLGGANGVFTRYADYGFRQLMWIHGALGGATTLATAASEIEDAEMELGVLRLTGPRLQASISGAMLLATWLDFLNLADAVLRQCPFYSVETLFVDLERVQKLIEPSMRALASLDPAQVEAATIALPDLMAQLTREFHSLRERARTANERGGRVMAAAQFVEMITMISALRMSLPRLPPSAPALVGAELAVSSGGVMMGSQLVVTAEWVEMMRRLVQAGVLSVPVVSAAVRIHAGQVMMAQAHQELPQGVRDALGDGPEVGAMRETGKTGAGMAERPQHHVMPQEEREWFEKRGFTGAMDIDQFCIEMDEADHQAIHGGGNWRQGRKWPGEWNQMIMEALRDAEAEAGRMLTRNEILNIVAAEMRRCGLPMNFTPWRGR
jgi:hypothetical protein